MRARQLTSLALLAVLAAGCGSLSPVAPEVPIPPPPPEGPEGTTGDFYPPGLAITLHNSGSPVGTTNERPLEAPEFIVTLDGEPQSGVVVSFEVARGGGSVYPQTITRADGLATPSWTFGHVGTQRLIAGIHRSGLPVASVQSEAISGPLFRLSPITSLEQEGIQGQPASEPPAVLVLDHRGNPAIGVPVRWSVRGGGRFTSVRQITDATGRSVVEEWVLGLSDRQSAGAQVLGGDTQVYFRVTARMP